MYYKPSNYAPGIIIETQETPFPDQFKEGPNGLWSKYGYILIV